MLRPQYAQYAWRTNECKMQICLLLLYVNKQVSVLLCCLILHMFLFVYQKLNIHNMETTLLIRLILTVCNSYYYIIKSNLIWCQHTNINQQRQLHLLAMTPDAEAILLGKLAQTLTTNVVQTHMLCTAYSAISLWDKLSRAMI